MEKGSFGTPLPSPFAPWTVFSLTFPKITKQHLPLLWPILFPVAVVSVEPEAHIQFKRNSREKGSEMGFY